MGPKTTIDMSRGIFDKLIICPVAPWARGHHRKKWPDAMGSKTNFTAAHEFVDGGGCPTNQRILLQTPIGDLKCAPLGRESEKISPKWVYGYLMLYGYLYMDMYMDTCTWILELRNVVEVHFWPYRKFPVAPRVLKKILTQFRLVRFEWCIISIPPSYGIFSRRYD